MQYNNQSAVRICLSVTNDIVTDQRVNRIASSLLKLYSSVTIVGRIRKNSPPLKSSDIHFKRFHLIFNKGPLFYACYNMRLFLYLLTNQFDILVANDLDTLPANFLVTKVKKARLIYDSHEYFTEVPELVSRKRVKNIWETIEKWILPKIKYSYTVCQSIADIYNEKYNTDMKVFRNLPAGKSGIKQTINLRKGDEHLILYQGSVNIGRGLETVIEAMHFLENTKFVIIGDGDIKIQLKQQVIGKDLVDKIIFLDRIPSDELPYYTNQADVGVSLEENLGLNYYYALPNKLFDYIQAKVPVLVSDFPEMGNIVKKYDIGLTTLSNNPREIAELIKLMLDDSQKSERWKKNLAKAAEELCWENEEEKLLNFYKSVT